MSQFSSSKRLCRWAGLTPGNNESAGKMPQDGMFVVYGIYENNGMEQLWQQLLSDSRSGITFDLYEIGIILFDKKITKQDYIVNF